MVFHILFLFCIALYSVVMLFIPLFYASHYFLNCVFITFDAFLRMLLLFFSIINRQTFKHLRGANIAIYNGRLLARGYQRTPPRVIVAWNVFIGLPTTTHSRPRPIGDGHHVCCSPVCCGDRLQRGGSVPVVAASAISASFAFVPIQVREASLCVSADRPEINFFLHFRMGAKIPIKAVFGSGLSGRTFKPQELLVREFVQATLPLLPTSPGFHRAS